MKKICFICLFLLINITNNVKGAYIIGLIKNHIISENELSDKERNNFNNFVNDFKSSKIFQDKHIILDNLSKEILKKTFLFNNSKILNKIIYKLSPDKNYLVVNFSYKNSVKTILILFNKAGYEKWRRIILNKEPAQLILFSKNYIIAVYKKQIYFYNIEGRLQGKYQTDKEKIICLRSDITKDEIFSAIEDENYYYFFKTDIGGLVKKVNKD